MSGTAAPSAFEADPLMHDEAVHEWGTESRQQIRIVIVAAYEPEPGSIPGELSLWIERESLTQRLEFAAGYRALWSNGEGVLAIAVGVGASRAAASLMALGLDPRFDLRRAFFLITGVAGISPRQGSLASVVLPRFVVDGSLAHEMDAREIPAGDARWPDGFVPIGKTTPYEQPRGARFDGDDGIAFALHQPLVDWAYAKSVAVALYDTEKMAARRMQFLPAETAQQPPKVLRGDEIASSTFWHGRAMSERARRWVEYQTDGLGCYAITAMEDAGIMQALTFLARPERVDLGRVLIVRGASNFDQQREGISAAESLAETQVVSYSAYRPALENAWRVGGGLMRALLAGWPQSPV